MKRLFKLAVIGAAVAAVAKAVGAKMAAGKEFLSGTETELRERTRDKLEDKVPEEKLRHVEDKVVEHARRKGTLSDDEAGSAE